MVRFIELLLKSRSTSTVGATNWQRMVRRGTPQGCVLSPLLWNLAVNSLLRWLEHSGNDAIAYADDIAIAASGICPKTPHSLNLALSIVLDWCRDFGLSINPSKTDTILFTRRYKIPNFSLLAYAGPNSLWVPKLNIWAWSSTPSSTGRWIWLLVNVRRHVMLTDVVERSKLDGAFAQEPLIRCCFLVDWFEQTTQRQNPW